MSKDIIQCFLMLFNSLTKKQQIIQVNHYTSIQEVKKDNIYNILKGSGCILKAKMHQINLKGPITTCTSCLIPIFRSNQRVQLLPMQTTNSVVKLPRLALQVEMSWHHSLVQSVGQSVVTQLSELVSCRLNMDILFVDTSGLSIHLYYGILWLF